MKTLILSVLLIIGCMNALAFDRYLTAKQKKQIEEMIQNKDYSNCLSQLDQWTKGCKKDYSLWLYKGICYNRLGNARAAEVLEKAKNLCSDRVEQNQVRIYLAEGYYTSGRKEECKLLCEEILADARLDQTTREWLEKMTGKMEEEEELAEAKMEQEKNRQKSVLQLSEREEAERLIAQKDYDGCLKRLKELENQYSRDYQIALYRWICYDQKGDSQAEVSLQNALDWCRDTIEQSHIKCLLAKQNLKSNHFQECISITDELISNYNLEDSIRLEAKKIRLEAFNKKKDLELLAQKNRLENDSTSGKGEGNPKEAEKQLDTIKKAVSSGVPMIGFASIPETDISIRFLKGSATYMPLALGNEKTHQKLMEVLQQNKERIEKGELMIRAEGVGNTELEILRKRCLYVKAYLIANSGIREKNFMTECKVGEGEKELVKIFLIKKEK